MTITHIHSVSAKEVHDELTLAMGTENVPGQWLVFVKAVRRLLPKVSVGRTPDAEIAASVVGQYGFKSWKEMVEAPVNVGGFNLKRNTFDKWSQAYSFILKHPYVESLHLSQGGVFRLRDKFQNLDLGFPENIEELEKSEVQIKKDSDKAKVDSITKLKSKIAELEKQLIVVNAKNETLLLNAGKLNSVIDEVVILKSENMLLVAKNEDLSNKNGERDHSARVQKKELDALRSRVDSMSAWDYFKKIFTG